MATWRNYNTSFQEAFESLLSSKAELNEKISQGINETITCDKFRETISDFANTIIDKMETKEDNIDDLSIICAGMHQVFVHGLLTGIKMGKL